MLPTLLSRTTVASLTKKTRALLGRLVCFSLKPSLGSAGLALADLFLFKAVSVFLFKAVSAGQGLGQALALALALPCLALRCLRRPEAGSAARSAPICFSLKPFSVFNSRLGSAPEANLFFFKAVSLFLLDLLLYAHAVGTWVSLCPPLSNVLKGMLTIYRNVNHWL